MLCCAVEDMVQHLGHRLQPFLPALMAITLHLLTSATANVPIKKAQAQGQGDMEVDVQQGQAQAQVQTKSGEDAFDRSREIRSGCLKLLAQVLLRFPAAVDYNPFWGPFLQAVVPLMPRLAVEASADK